MSTFDDRFGEMHDSAVLWGQRVEMAGGTAALDEMASDWLACTAAPTRGWARSHQRMTIRNIEGMRWNDALRGARSYRRRMMRALLDVHAFNTLVAGEAVYTPGINDRCDCDHLRSAHDGWFDGDGCLVPTCLCEWDGRDHDAIGMMIIADGYMI
jgi:hypothetical protein